MIPKGKSVSLTQDKCLKCLKSPETGANMAKVGRPPKPKECFWSITPDNRFTTACLSLYYFKQRGPVNYCPSCGLPIVFVSSLFDEEIKLDEQAVQPHPNRAEKYQ